MTEIKKHFANIVDSILPIAATVRDRPYALVFKTTNYCWCKCAHCCENSGPHNPREFMHENIIINYIAQASYDPKFSREVVFTGGEIFAAYKRGLAYYVPKLLKTCVENGIAADIKTNAAWVRMKEAPQIFNDLDEISRIKRPYAYQISLSLDKYHPRSLDNVATVIETLAQRKCRIWVNITSFNESLFMYDELKARLAMKNIPVVPTEMFLDNRRVSSNLDMVNDSIVIKPPRPTVPLASGRGKFLPEASKLKFPQFKIMGEDKIVLIAFDSEGRASLGENCGKNIWSAYSTKDGYKPLAQVKKDLTLMARFDEMDALMKSTWLFHRSKIKKSRH